MTEVVSYKIYFIEKTKAQLCHYVHTTNSAWIKAIIVNEGTAHGYEVRVEEEH